jgi:D-aminoacyl-tRNA deacylase
LDELGHPRSNEARAVLEAAFERSSATHALLDGDHPELARTIEELGYRVVSETWVRTVGDRPLALVRALESGVATVDEGLRFGAHVPEDPEAWEVVSLPDDLLAAAQNVDGEGTRAAVAGATVAFDTIENGTRARGEAAVPDGERYEELVDELAAILRAAYDEVRIADDAVIAREQAFDPEKAQKLGVPEGPKMGQLSGGEAVEVGDEEIPPSAVLSEREERFPV